MGTETGFGKTPKETNGVIVSHNPQTGDTITCATGNALKPGTLIDIYSCDGTHKGRQIVDTVKDNTTMSMHYLKWYERLWYSSPVYRLYARIKSWWGLRRVRKQLKRYRYNVSKATDFKPEGIVIEGNEF